VVFEVDLEESTGGQMDREGVLFGQMEMDRRALSLHPSGKQLFPPLG
jgi:FtsZ-interacting cell division protein ZipA